MNRPLKDRIITMAGAGIMFLSAFYFNSFARTKDIDQVNNRIQALEKEATLHAKKSNLLLIMSGLCIMDKRTCELKKDIKE